MHQAILGNKFCKLRLSAKVKPVVSKCKKIHDNLLLSICWALPRPGSNHVWMVARCTQIYKSCLTNKKRVTIKSKDETGHSSKPVVSRD